MISLSALAERVQGNLCTALGGVRMGLFGFRWALGFHLCGVILGTAHNASCLRFHWVLCWSL